nr:carboxylesterase COEC4 [Dendroctonus rhizophagus]
MTENTIVRVSEGELKGKVCANCTENGSYFSFQGIPYAKPPLGKLRFKAPQPPEKWTGIRDATQEGSECYSKSLITNAIVGSEDCLFLNVYTPKLCSNQFLPVMVWIHGGGFTKGSGGTDLFGPDYLVEKDVVLVTLNYRIGALGFLAFSDPSIGVPGNAGLKDMVMALKWVQKNIREFCGDPKNVTVFGESAGAAAVHFLVLSPMAKGLFHKAIMQSGSALNSFIRGKQTSTYELAQKLGIDSHSDKLILSELQKVPVEELFKASQAIWDSFLISNIRPFCPVIEPKSKEPGLITEEPLELLKSGRYNKVPMIIGYNTLEGIFIYAFMKVFSRRGSDYFLSDMSLVPYTLNLRINSEAFKRVSEEIRRMYGITGEENLMVEADMEKGIKLYTHNYFLTDIYKSAVIHSKTSKFPVFFYRFDLDTDLNFIKKISQVKTKGAGHADDLPYFFKTIVTQQPKAASLEYKLIQKMTKLWTNFAKVGNPTPSINDLEIMWKPTKKDELNFISMENGEFRLLVDPEKEFIDFWKNLYRKHQVQLSKL